MHNWCFENVHFFITSYIRVFQRNRTNRIYVYTCKYTKKFVIRIDSQITEAEKSPGLPAANRRPRKAGSVIQSESKSLRTRVAESINLSLNTEDEMHQTVR